MIVFCVIACIVMWMVIAFSCVMPHLIVVKSWTGNGLLLREKVWGVVAVILLDILLLFYIYLNFLNPDFLLRHC